MIELLIKLHQDIEIGIFYILKDYSLNLPIN